MKTISIRFLTVCSAVLYAASAVAQAPPRPDPLGTDLYRAISRGDCAAVSALLAKGAKINAKNWLGITPLYWAATVGQEGCCRVLLDAKADPNVATQWGLALNWAEVSGNVGVVKLLLDRGAKFSTDRIDGITPLMTAAENDRVEMMKLLIAHGLDVNAADSDGVTPLMYAARSGRCEAAALLGKLGANVNVADSHGQTALMAAAMNGYAEMSRFLIANGANVNAADKSGDTPLILVARYSGSRTVARVLMAHGAKATDRNSRGQTALTTALARGRGAVANVIAPGLNAETTASAPLETRARNAVIASLPLIDKATRTFTSMAACVSCHHEGLGLIVTGFATDHGFKSDPAVIAGEMKKMGGFLGAMSAPVKGVLPIPPAHKMLPFMDMDEYSDGMTYAAAGLAAHHVPADETLRGIIRILAEQQRADGSWGFILHREPIQSSRFTTTAWAIRVLRAYMPADRVDETNQRVAKAVTWLSNNRGETTEDRAFRLMGLKWASAPAVAISTALADLKQSQRVDGGWAQRPVALIREDAYARSDAYATGLALVALNTGGGVPVANESYRRGTLFLLNSQDDDGSWYVPKRAIPYNTYFDAGFPHGESQFISYAATCWADMALMLAADPKRSNYVAEWVQKRR